MPARSAFDYAIIRVVPRIERGEFVNAGVIVFCRERAFLGARVRLDTRRLLALEPDLDPTLLAEIGEHLGSFPRVAAGEPDAGDIARLPQPERYHWLVAPRSTVVQVSEAHAGLSNDPVAALDHLFATLVLPPPSDPSDPSDDAAHDKHGSDALPNALPNGTTARHGQMIRLRRASYEAALGALEHALLAADGMDGSTREDVARAARALAEATNPAHSQEAPSPHAPNGRKTASSTASKMPRTRRQGLREPNT